MAACVCVCPSKQWTVTCTLKEPTNSREIKYDGVISSSPWGCLCCVQLPQLQYSGCQTIPTWNSDRSRSWTTWVCLPGREGWWGGEVRQMEREAGMISVLTSLNAARIISRVAGRPEACIGRKRREEGRSRPQRRPSSRYASSQQFTRGARTRRVRVHVPSQRCSPVTTFTRREAISCAAQLTGRSAGTGQ